MPDEPAVDGAGAKLAASGTRRTVRHAIDQPSDLACRKQRIDGETASRLDEHVDTTCAQDLAVLVRAVALPDDDGTERLPARALPKDDRFALIRDRDGLGL